MTEINIIESLYGKDKFDSVETIEHNEKTYIGWYVKDYETIEDLRKDFPTDFDIINLYQTEPV